MSEIEDNVEQVELTIEAGKANIKLWESLDRLSNNRDFKAVIAKGYFEKEPIRLVMLKSDPSMSESDQKDIDKAIVGVGALRQYFSAIYAIANQSKMAMAEYYETIEELRQEQINGKEGDI